MQYGEVVTYIRNGVALNALVLHSQKVERKVDIGRAGAVTDEGVRVVGEEAKLEHEERLILAYADPSFESTVMSGTNTAKAIATAFDVPEHFKGSNSGWLLPGVGGNATADAADELRAHVEAATAVLTK